MLAPDSRRTLIDQLRPPVGYRLDAAVGTTFTLDLTAALVPPLAFASFAVRSTTDPVSVLEAVRSCADRVDVFAQEGYVRAPSRYTALTAFLEPMLHEVQAPPGGLFHPKLWLMRFTADDEADAYRLVVLSRNLTEDHAWDVSLTLDGLRGTRPTVANRPLSALVRSLPGRTRQPVPVDRRGRIDKLAEDVRYMEWERPEGVTELAFHVFGVANERAAPDFTGYGHLVVSPFLNDAGLAQLTAGTKSATVVSRAASLDSLAPETVQGLDATYVVSTVAGLDDGDATEDDKPAGLLNDLHAKLVVVERGQQAHLFLGSANATDAALNRNIEILVQLSGGKKNLGVGTMLDPGSPFLGMLEQYDTVGGALPDPDAEAQWQLENALRVLASRRWVVSVGRSDGAYSLRFETRDGATVPAGMTARVEPLAHPGVACTVDDGRTSHGTVEGVPLIEVSPFLRLSLTDGAGREAACVVRAELRGDPEGRLDEVLASQINTPEKFLRFLALLLGLGQAHPLAMVGLGGASAGTSGELAPAPQVFEIVIRALARSPESIGDLNRLVQRMLATENGVANLPEGFASFWDVVTASRIKLNPEATR
ncbi:phospholipase D family protein [Rhodococcus sp. H36-A4]|uniref:phospholipase D family protein n=1 Tax=Rhodococcus sp. H36-A4 TaxID=3004353 RepID=UPI0022B01315|nr:phospholipase D family protein [Rhodococcus sp. H36-A4]MCZ4080298.1 phospholipase D family protein [Rhodococcus sp. H36-A4]